MKHLTEMQVQQFVDGTADYMTQATCTNHLATCAQCRREVELQKALLKTARETGLVMPSRSFTRRLMARIAPSRTRMAGRWVLNNMGSMFGMMAVVGLTGSVVLGTRGEGTVGLSLPSFDLSAGSGRATELWAGFSEFVGQVLGNLDLPGISGEGQATLILTSVAILLLLDRYLRTRLGASAKG